MSFLKVMSPLWFVLLLPVSVWAQQTPLLISPLTGDFYVYTTYKLHKGTLYPSNSLYVVTGSGVIMIDTPWDTTQTEPLLDSIEKRHHQKVVLCVATHYHDDRTGGFDILKRNGIKTYSSRQTWLQGKEHSEKLAEYQFVQDTTFRVGNCSFQTYFPGEGHTKDNIVVWFPAAKVLHGGCLVKSIEATGMGNTADSNLEQWPLTIKRLMKKFPNPAFVIPGHQNWSGPKALKHTLKLLKAHRKRS